MESSRTRQERIQSSRCVFFLLSTSIPIIPNSGFCQATFHLWLRSRQIIRTTACWKREREAIGFGVSPPFLLRVKSVFYHYVRFVFYQSFLLFSLQFAESFCHHCLNSTAFPPFWPFFTQSSFLFSPLSLSLCYLTLLPHFQSAEQSENGR